MLGYGVPYEASVAARLAALARVEVLNASVPSWGPTEYLLGVEELAARYRPSHVVFVANVANDWFEATVPNLRRSTAEDGWAARYTPGMRPPRTFPGRSFLFGESHFVFALRELMQHARTGELPPAESALQLMHDLPQLVRTDGPHRSRLAPTLLAVRDRCRALGCTVLAVALPLDVQVDGREWAKYRATPTDLSTTERLLDDFVADARDQGIAAIDLLQVLRASSPGAFLPDDYHLSAKGHGAIAEAIAELTR
jgi:hypothetical protein